MDPPVGQPTRIDVRWPDASLETCQALSDGSSDYVVSIEMHHSRDHVAPHSRPARIATVPVQDEVDVQTLCCNRKLFLYVLGVSREDLGKHRTRLGCISRCNAIVMYLIPLRLYQRGDEDGSYYSILYVS